MSDEKESPPSPSPAEKPAGTAQPAATPPRKTRFIFKVLGVLVIVFAAWLALCSYRKGELVDLTDCDAQQQLWSQAEEDISKVGEATATVAVDVVTWTQRSLTDVRKVIKGKPPETKAESSALVRESTRATRARSTPPKSTVATAPRTPDPLQPAREEYRKGEEAYAKTDPMAPTEEVQRYVCIAEPFFARCMDLLEQARKRGVKGPEIENLEQAAAKRLYDCRKRMVLRVR